MQGKTCHFRLELMEGQHDQELRQRLCKRVHEFCAEEFPGLVRRSSVQFGCLLAAIEFEPGFELTPAKRRKLQDFAASLVDYMDCAEVMVQAADGEVQQYSRGQPTCFPWLTARQATTASDTRAGHSQELDGHACCRLCCLKK